MEIPEQEDGAGNLEEAGGGQGGGQPGGAGDEDDQGRDDQVEAEGRGLTITQEQHGDEGEEGGDGDHDSRQAGAQAIGNVHGVGRVS